MVINQGDLINKIAYTEDIPVTTVRNVFNAAESIIFAYLSSTTPTQDYKIKILDGLSIDSKYMQEYDSGYICTKDYIKTKANISRHYKDKINKKI